MIGKRLKYALVMLVALFSLNATNLYAGDCYSMPEDKDGIMNNKDFDRAGSASKLDGQVANTAQELILCGLGVATAGMDPVDVFDNTCGCMKAVKDNCKFEYDDGEWEVSGPASCPIFLPICYSGRC